MIKDVNIKKKIFLILIKNTKTSKIQKRVIPYTGTKTHTSEDVTFDNINEWNFFVLEDHCLRLHFNKLMIRIIEFFLIKKCSYYVYKTRGSEM